MNAWEAGRDPDMVLKATAMEWLRAVLTFSGGEPAAEPFPTGQRPPTLELLPESDVVDPSTRARRARRDLERAMGSRPAPRFRLLCDAFRLYPFERDVLLLCFCHAVSTEVARWCSTAPGSMNGLPTYAMAMGMALDPEWDQLPPTVRRGITRVSSAPEWDALSPARPLRSWRILEIAQPPAQALISSPLRLDERIVNHLMGLDHLDERLAAVTDPCDDGGAALSPVQQSRIADVVKRLRAPGRRRRRAVQMPGGDSATKGMFAREIARACRMELHRVRLDRVFDPDDLGGVVRLWNRETRLRSVALLVEATDPEGAASTVLSRFLDGLEGLVLVDVPEPLPHRTADIILDVTRPKAAEQRAVWEEVLGHRSRWPDRLAAQFDLNLGELSDVAAAAGPRHAGAGDGRELDVGEVAWAFCRDSARPRLEGLAQRIVSETRLQDVHLAAEDKRLLEKVRDQTRHRLRVYDDFGFRGRLSRGLGITVLLAGESGTGKTMAAEALANELALDLYRVDLSSVVSKYIGETEKNIRRVFDAAEQSGAVLLFDEADAIFGKRSEVQDSHDRYANIEVSYLLQRMEAYTGLALLTTNMKNALDVAFLRRLRFIITFPYPGVAEREKIWRGIFPRAAAADPSAAALDRRTDTDALVPGTDRLDYRRLAQANLTGGQIRNIAVNAAFLAAAKDGPVTMGLLREAAQDELRKNGKPVAAAEFLGWEEPATSAAAAGRDLAGAGKGERP